MQMQVVVLPVPSYSLSLMVSTVGLYGCDRKCVAAAYRLCKQKNLISIWNKLSLCKKFYLLINIESWNKIN